MPATLWTTPPHGTGERSLAALARELVTDGARRAPQLHTGDRWNITKGIDLAVRMGNRSPDVAATVLENKDVIDIRTRPEHFCPLGPQGDHQPQLVRAEGAEALVVLRRKKHDLAAVIRQRRPAVFEPTHVVLVWRLEPARAKRAVHAR